MNKLNEKEYNNLTKEQSENDITTLALHSLFKQGIEAIEQDDFRKLLRVVNDIQDSSFQNKRVITEAVDVFIKQAHGKEFHIREVYSTLHITTRQEKQNISKILNRKVDKGELIKPRKENGWFRAVQDELCLMDWKNADTTGVPLKFPLGIEKMVKIFPRNIILLAGYPNTGKSSFCLEFARLNKKERDIYYFNSEMGEDEFRYRLELFDMDLDEWQRGFYPFPCSEGFEDVIRADEVNIIDFLEITEDFSLVGDKIKKIYNSLGTGIALIALQKSLNRDTGRGDTLSLEKPRLYLSMNYGKLKIVKAKNWVTHENPNEKMIDFKLVNGSKFVPQGIWHNYDPYDKKPWERS